MQKPTILKLLFDKTYYLCKIIALNVIITILKTSTGSSSRKSRPELGASIINYNASKINNNMQVFDKTVSAYGINKVIMYIVCS